MMEDKPVFVKIGSKYYLQSQEYITVEVDEDGNEFYYCENGDDYFLSACDFYGHEFFDEDSVVLASGDIEKKCFCCENTITFYHYTAEEMRTELMSLDNLPN